MLMLAWRTYSHCTKLWIIKVFWISIKNPLTYYNKCCLCDMFVFYDCKLEKITLLCFSLAIVICSASKHTLKSINLYISCMYTHMSWIVPFKKCTILIKIATNKRENVENMFGKKKRKKANTFRNKLKITSFKDVYV